MQTNDRGLLHVVHSNPPSSAAEELRAPIEGLMLSLGKLGVRVVALTAPTGDQNVRGLAKALAASFAAADVKAALIDLDPAGVDGADDIGWNPGGKLAAAHISRDPSGYDVVAARPDSQTRALFNNLQHLKRSLAEDFGSYRIVIVSMAPVLAPSPSAPNPVSVARAADGVIVVCGTARTNADDAAKAVAELNSVGCNVIGTVLDDTHGLMLGVELAAMVERLRYVPVWLKQRVCGLLRTNALLNS